MGLHLLRQPAMINFYCANIELVRGKNKSSSSGCVHEVYRVRIFVKDPLHCI